MPSIFHQFVINANAKKVFDSLCLPEGLNAWWTLESEGEPLLNATYKFYFGPEYDWRAKVIFVEPNKSLTWKMTESMDDWMPTKVGFTLTEESSARTVVNFFHKDWTIASEHFAITNFCWGQLLNNLKKYVETNEVIPFEKRN